MGCDAARLKLFAASVAALLDENGESLIEKITLEKRPTLLLLLLLLPTAIFAITFYSNFFVQEK